MLWFTNAVMIKITYHAYLENFKSDKKTGLHWEGTINQAKTRSHMLLRHKNYSLSLKSTEIAVEGCIQCFESGEAGGNLFITSS